MRTALPGRVRKVGHRSVAEFSRIPPARVQHGRLPPRPLLHARLPLQVPNCVCHVLLSVRVHVMCLARCVLNSFLAAEFCHSSAHKSGTHFHSCSLQLTARTLCLWLGGLHGLLCLDSAWAAMLWLECLHGLLCLFIGVVSLVTKLS